MNPRRDIFHALADPTRRSIVLLLTAGAITPNVIAGNFESSRQAISKHLQILTECELVKPKQQGREIYYHLNAPKIGEMENWLKQFHQLLEKRFAQLDVVLSELKTRNQE